MPRQRRRVQQKTKYAMQDARDERHPKVSEHQSNAVLVESEESKVSLLADVDNVHVQPH